MTPCCNGRGRNRSGTHILGRESTQQQPSRNLGFVQEQISASRDALVLLSLSPSFHCLSRTAREEGCELHTQECHSDTVAPGNDPSKADTGRFDPRLAVRAPALSWSGRTSRWDPVMITLPSRGDSHQGESECLVELEPSAFLCLDLHTSAEVILDMVK